MNASELVDAIATDENSRDTSKSTVKWVLDTMAAQVARALREGHDVVLPGLGKLVPVSLAAKTGRNPRTGQDITIPARNAAKFRPAKALKDALN